MGHNYTVELLYITLLLYNLPGCFASLDVRRVHFRDFALVLINQVLP